MINYSRIIRLPSYPIYVIGIIIFIITEISKYGLVEVSCTRYTEDECFMKHLKSIIVKAEPFEYAYCTIVWVLILKRLYISF